LAGRVPLKIAYALTCRILGLVVLLCRGDRVKDAELLVLRYEIAVLRRQSGLVRYQPADRVWFATLARLIPRSRRIGVFPVCPPTLLAWHRRLAAKQYDTSKRRKPGRPPGAEAVESPRHVLAASGWVAATRCRRVRRRVREAEARARCACSRRLSREGRSTGLQCVV
jgi:hypothetical protein